MNWYLEVLKKYAVFQGRARRKEYWMFQLINFIILIVLRIIGGVLEMHTYGDDMNALMAIYSLAVLLPNIGVQVRRLHDTGRTGWWILIGLIPLIGFIVLLVFDVLDSEPDNQYGPNPKKIEA